MSDRTREADDRAEIRQLIDDWVIWRDSADWDRLARCWHPGGRIVTTWYQSTGADFVARSRRAWDEGLNVLHTLGGSSVELNGDRAVAQTRMMILQRAPVHGVLADVRCYGRFWDALEKRDGRWALMLRQPIYEGDSLNPVDPSATVVLAPEVLAAYPEGYRHLAYLQSQLGFDVARDLPGTRGPEVAALQARGRRWLAGEPVSCLDRADAVTVAA